MKFITLKFLLKSKILSGKKKIKNDIFLISNKDIKISEYKVKVQNILY